MHAQLRATKVGLKAVPQLQRRLLATPPTPIVVGGLPPPPPSGALPVRPVVVTATTIPPTPGSSSLPPPPPPPPSGPPPPPRRFFRKFLIYTAVGVLTFYPLSGYLSTKNETYRELFTQVPGGEFVADYADDNHWENLGFGTVSKKAVQGWQGVTGDAKDKSVEAKNTIAKQAERAGNKLERAGDKVERAAKKGGEEVKGSAIDLKEKAVHAAHEAGERAKKYAAEASEKAKQLATDASDKAKHLASEASSKASRAATEAKNLASDASAKTKNLASEASEKTKEVAAGAEQKLEQVPAKFSEGVEGIVRQAEKALHIVEDEAIKAEKAIAPQPTGPRSLPDTQRPRELRPETVKPTKTDPTIGKEKYSGPPLPLGFEPPPGYYVAAPKKPEKPVEGAPLPLLAPKVKDFASEEPIIAQLASTIDSLTSSLSSANAGSANATGILTKAHDDLSALSTRLGQVKKTEKEKLEKTIKEKTAEFESLLKTKAEEAKKGEQGLKAGWEQERQSMVDKWRGELEGELETQRTGIDKRLREEVVSQGIELQRRWLRSIKTQVETERGGRLAKLDQLTTSLKQLERITLDNSATLDENVRVNKVWSALRALQSKTDLGDVAFDHELRVLKSLTLAADTDSVDKTFASVISPALRQLEASGAATTGVKSFASLSSWFTNSVAPRIHSASLTPTPEESTVVSHLASIVLSKIMFRPKAGVVSGDDVGSVLARAEWCLGEKDLDGAAREINGLKGWPGKLAGDWLREARRKLEVQQALEVVMTEATLESLLLS